MKARQINDTIRYTMWSVFRQHGPLAGGCRRRSRGPR